MVPSSAYVNPITWFILYFVSVAFQDARALSKGLLELLKPTQYNGEYLEISECMPSQLKLLADITPYLDDGYVNVEVCGPMQAGIKRTPAVADTGQVVDGMWTTKVTFWALPLDDLEHLLPDAEPELYMLIECYPHMESLWTRAFVRIDYLQANAGLRSSIHEAALGDD